MVYRESNGLAVETEIKFTIPGKSSNNYGYSSVNYVDASYGIELMTNPGL